jgi:hypothetical protein
MSSIITYLPELPHPAAEKALNNKLSLVKNCSDDCLRYARTIEEAFEKWLELVCEVHQVTVAKEDQTSIAQQKNEVLMSGIRIEAEMTESSLKNAKETAKEMKEQMVQSRKLFEEAVHSVPGREHFFFFLQTIPQTDHPWI